MTSPEPVDLLGELAALLGADRLLGPDARGPSPERDLCRYPLGRPLAWVQPRDTAEVVRLVAFARARRTPLVPVGRRTAYWRPLHLDGSIALDVARLDGIEPPDVEAGFVRCGAGAEVRAIDDVLRAHGAVLAAFPDAFGDTSIGAMVATGFASGVGMGNAPFASTVVGLRVVLGTGEVLSTGAGEVLGASPFLRAGLPDPTELFFASDGALGVVTEVALRPWRRVPLAQLAWKGPEGLAGQRAAVALARRLRAPGLYETLRAVSTFEAGAWSQVEVDVAVPGPLGVAELDARVRAVTALAEALFAGAAVSAWREIPGRPGRIPMRTFRDARPGDHWRQMSTQHFVGVDVIVPYTEIEACFAVVEEIRADAVSVAGFRAARSALYFSPELVNLGLHLELQRGDDAGAAHALIERAMGRFAPLRVTPYRWGRLWGQALGPKLDPVYRSLLRDVKRRCDPDGILHPGASIFDGG